LTPLLQLAFLGFLESDSVTLTGNLCLFPADAYQMFMFRAASPLLFFGMLLLMAGLHWGVDSGCKKRGKPLRPIHAFSLDQYIRKTLVFH
jgi:hypothetical protein